MTLTYTFVVGEMAYSLFPFAWHQFPPPPPPSVSSCGQPRAFPALFGKEIEPHFSLYVSNESLRVPRFILLGYLTWRTNPNSGELIQTLFRCSGSPGCKDGCQGQWVMPTDEGDLLPVFRAAGNSPELILASTWGENINRLMAPLGLIPFAMDAHFWPEVLERHE